MSDAYVWTVILGLAALTYLNRFSFLGLLGGRDVPPWARRALAYVPTAVLPALIAPMVLIDRSTGGLTPPSAWIAAAVALLLGALTRNLALTIIGGMAAVHVARYAGL
jgi:branched-subunit amino acid transport protein